MWHQIKSYLKFLLQSKNQHGIHSPFVYDLVTKCFYDNTKYVTYKTINSFRNKLLQNHESIKTTDFGAGSRVFKSDERMISAIAKNAGITKKRQQLLFRLVKYFNSETILELGTSLGLGTSAIALANPSAKITTLEGCTNTSKIAQNLFKEFGLNSIELQTTTFEDYFKNSDIENYDLVIIDGNHHKKNTLNYFEIILEKINSNSILIFDDIYWSPEMTAAWHQIIQHQAVTVSIDTYYWGIIFFRKEQQKQHFTIRV